MQAENSVLLPRDLYYVSFMLMYSYVYSGSTPFSDSPNCAAL